MKTEKQPLFVFQEESAREVRCAVRERYALMPRDSWKQAAAVFFSYAGIHSPRGSKKSIKTTS